MKKLLAMLLVLAMISCLFVACANNDSETDAPTTAPTDESKTNESTDTGLCHLGRRLLDIFDHGIYS